MISGIRDQIQSVLQTGNASGMITMESSLKALCDRGLITYEDALGAALDPRELARLMGRSQSGSPRRARHGEVGTA